jgi:hypothetical protein
MRDAATNSLDASAVAEGDSAAREYSAVDRYAGLNASNVEIADCLGGVEAIAKFLGWPIRKVRYARETGALPIRVKPGVGLYAFKSEIVAALKTPDTLVPKAPNKAH